MEFVDDVSWGNADSRDEEFRAAGYDDVDELVEVAFGVVGLR